MNETTIKVRLYEHDDLEAGECKTEDNADENKKTQDSELYNKAKKYAKKGKKICNDVNTTIKNQDGYRVYKKAAKYAKKGSEVYGYVNIAMKIGSYLWLI